jgi:hypothetical protein
LNSGYVDLRCGTADTPNLPARLTERSVFLRRRVEPTGYSRGADSLLDVGNISAVVTAVATIITLIFLSIQVRANTKLTRTSTLGAMLQSARDRTAMNLSDNGEVSEIIARGANSLELLDEAEKFRFAFFMVDMSLHMQNIMELHRAGLMPKVDHDAWLEWTSAVLRTPGGAAIWPQVSAVITSTIRDLLQEHIDRNPNSPTIIDIMPIFRRSTESLKAPRARA